MIIQPNQLKNWLYNYHGILSGTVGCVSGGFDCLHRGHLHYINEAKSQCQLLIVLANTDDFLIKKKGYVYIPQDERLAILHSLSSVDWVIPWNDGTDHVAGALRLIKPDYFFNGGDRSSLDKQHPEEIKACLECGIALKLGIGGDEKCVSSSQITKYFVDNYLTNIIWKQK